MKKILSIICVLTMITALFSGCGYEYFDLNLEGEYDRSLAGTNLYVYNWGEYISDGSDDSIDVNKEFEKLTGIKVHYSNFESNETMYSQLKSGGVSYDVVIPSDYMIARLINENMLCKIDNSMLSNYHYISDEYHNLFFDENDEYSVPYCVGMVGIIYNPTLTGEDIEHSWNVLWDEKYKDMVLNFNNPRDAFLTSQMLLGIDLNTENKADWKRAADKLIEGKANLQSYVMDEVYGKMETGEAAISPYYAGDYLTMLDNNPDLKFFYPKEGTNIFVDSACIPSSAQNYEAALMYINFLLEPEIACANADYIGYASPHSDVIANEDYYYYQNEILYPAEENKPKTQYYHAISEDVRKYYENLWIDVKLY